MVLDRVQADLQLANRLLDQLALFPVTEIPSIPWLPASVPNYPFPYGSGPDPYLSPPP